MRLSRKYGVWCDAEQDLHRFAERGSISRRVGHRFIKLKCGDIVDINPIYAHPGWKPGFVQKLDEDSGQIGIGYYLNSHNSSLLINKLFSYWTHIDNYNEIRAPHDIFCRVNITGVMIYSIHHLIILHFLNLSRINSRQ